MNIYKILETFGELDSATNRLAEVTEDDFGARDPDIDESQTKVQTIGNKVRVTTDGDTTEFDDVETAAAFTGGDGDGDQFTTESEDDLGTWDTDIGENATCEDEGPEFATFDSENEAHRKRLQRGTPVVLSKELFTDENVSRRGVFVNRSPSGSFGTVVRDLDGKEVKVHLSDITSADLVNNSIYEEFGINLEAMLSEEVTMTQTTNLENPENDTTTVTAVGPEAGEELAAIMTTAGLNTGKYADLDALPIDAGEVDTGEPEVEPEQMGMVDMFGMMDDPEVHEAFGEMDPAEKIGHEADEISFDWDAEGPSDADLDAIDSDPEWELDFEESVDREDDAQYLSPEVAQAVIAGTDIYDLIHDESVSPKDREALSRDIDELMLGGDTELTAYENLASRIYDQFGGLDEVRDIEHANTPDELTSGVDMVTHGTSGGLNRPKRMYKPAGNRHGDNAMQRPLEAMFDEAMDIEEELSPEAQKIKDASFAKAKADRDWSTRSKGSRLRGRGRGTGQYDRSVKFGLGEGGGTGSGEEEFDEPEDQIFVNVHESVDNFLDLYKEFKIRGEKK